MTDPALPPPESVKIGIVSISDRASSGVYEDKGLPALQDWLARALHNPIEFVPRLIADEQQTISEATLAIAHKEMPGFGEQMRSISLRFVPTAILSRQVAVIRSQSLIINLPGQPKAIAETLEGARAADGSLLAAGIFAAVPYCIDLIGGPYLETREAVCKAFRPKTAQRPLRD